MAQVNPIHDDTVDRDMVIDDICEKLAQAEKSVADGKVYDLDTVFQWYRDKYPVD